MILSEIFSRSVKKWGFHSQLDMLAEECAELAVATLHLNRTVKNADDTMKMENIEHFAEEIADVEFLIEEMKFYSRGWSWNLEAKIKEYRRIKEARLVGYLEERP